jgi:hypothetical protein
MDPYVNQHPSEAWRPVSDEDCIRHAEEQLIRRRSGLRDAQ